MLAKTTRVDEGPFDGLHTRCHAVHASSLTCAQVIVADDVYVAKGTANQGVSLWQSSEDRLPHNPICCLDFCWFIWLAGITRAAASLTHVSGADGLILAICRVTSRHVG